MSQPDPQPSPQIDQSQQSGGVNLGAYNRIQQLEIGDTFTGDKIVVQKLELIIYTGDARPSNAEMRAALLRAYRSEVAARYALWRRRYATLPMVALPVVASRAAGGLYEREDLTFVALRQAFTAEAEVPEAARSDTHTFTDLREGLISYGHLLLLGPPGGGKTTALWRLALDLAEAGLAGDDSAPLPVFVRLGGLQPGQTLRALLESDLSTASLEDAHGRRFPLIAHRGMVELLDELLQEGRLVLLWDGLNEVPRSQFAASAHALDAFRRDHPGRLGGALNASVTTCRADDHALLLEECRSDPYPVQGVTIQGLDPETIRQVVIGRLGETRGIALLDTLTMPEHTALASLARTPLLLTMLCEVYDAAGTLPRNRGQLLQQFVARRWAWEHERRPEGWIKAEVQERALARLAYEMTQGSGRGTSVPATWAVQHFRAETPQVAPDELFKLGKSADLLELLADGAQVRFTHQLVQEYFAAVALRKRLQRAEGWKALPIVGEAASQRMLRRYARIDKRTNWEETLLLLAGIDGEGSLAQRLMRVFLGDPVRAARVLLASDLPPSPDLKEELFRSLPPIYRDVSIAEARRLEVGSLYSQLQYEYIPITLPEWQREIQRRNQQFGAPTGYFCYLPAGRYPIGGWEKDAPTVEHNVAAFWVARLPITVAQFARFVTEGYRDDRHWTPNGLAWRKNCIAPEEWNNPCYSGVNQPVTFITWYEATAFCRWLSEQLAAMLPAGYELRLPSEAEWEVAAAYDGSAAHRTYPWGEGKTIPEQAVYAAWKLDAPAPVGLCPAGAAACGALDLVGNVWEWTASSNKGYPVRSATLIKDFTAGDVPVRGGAYWEDRAHICCGARNWIYPVYWNRFNSFRAVMAPLLAQMS